MSSSWVTPSPGTRCATLRTSLSLEEGHIICFLRDGDRVFRTYSTTGRGNEPVDGSSASRHDAFGRRETWQDKPRVASTAVLVLLGRGRERQLGADQPTRTRASGPARRSPHVESLGRHGHNH